MDQPNSENQNQELTNTMEHSMTTEPVQANSSHPTTDGDDIMEFDHETDATSIVDLPNLPEQDIEMSNTLESHAGMSVNEQRDASNQPSSLSTVHKDDLMATDPLSESENKAAPSTSTEKIVEVSKEADLSEIKEADTQVAPNSQPSSPQNIPNTDSSTSVEPKADISGDSGIVEENSLLNFCYGPAFEESLIKEGAIIEVRQTSIEREQTMSSPSPSDARQPSSTPNDRKPCDHNAAVPKKILGKEEAAHVRNLTLLPLPTLSRTTIHAFFAFLYLLTQRHWDPSILKRKLLFFQEVEARLQFPSPMRHFITKKRFMGAFQAAMLDMARKHWEKTHKKEWACPPPIEGYDENHPRFEDITIPFIGWDKREDRELQAFSTLILCKVEKDKEFDAALVADGKKATNYSLEARKLVALVADPPQLLERIKELRMKVDEVVRLMEEEANSMGPPDYSSLSQDEFIEYYTYYLPAPTQQSKIVNTRKPAIKPAKVTKPTVAKPKSASQTSAVRKPAPVACTNIKKRKPKENASSVVKKSETTRPTKTTPPANESSSQKAEEKVAVTDKETSKSTLPETIKTKTISPKPELNETSTAPVPAKPRLVLKLVTKPGTAHPVHKPSTSKKRKNHEDDDFVVADDWDEDILPQRKRRVRK